MNAIIQAGQALLLDRITHRYAGHTAVDAVTLDIEGGELIALLGPSGCGKTTLLRIVAGLVRQSAGLVVVAGRPIDALPPNRCPVGIVFQSYALFPHMSVADNVAHGLAARGIDRAAQRKEAARMLELVQLGHLADRLPRALSGGQRQRMALARALAVQAGDPAAGRAVPRTRQEPAPRHADRDQAHPAPGRDHDDPGHA